MKKAFGQTRVLLAAVAATALVGSAAPATAGILFSGTGVWDTSAISPDVTTSPYSAPGEAWSFSFVLPNTLSTTTTAFGVETTQALFVKYTLNGAPVSTTLDSVEFFPAANSGGFDLHFNDHTITIYGPDVGSSGKLATTAFVGQISLDDGPNDEGAAKVALTAVPEPATWAMMLMGFGAMGVAVRSARRKSAAATA